MTIKKQHILAVTNGSVSEAAEHHIGDVSYLSEHVSEGKGFIRFNKGFKGLPFDTNDVVVAPRDILETSDDYMQIIPYIVTMRDGKILSYTRTKTGGESRLHDNVSIGFGGHIDVGDVSVKNGKQEIDVEATVANAASREMNEELTIQGAGDTFNAVGMIVDRSNPVGMVHVGVVIIVNTDGIVTSNEDQIDLHGFKTKEELLEVENLENWTGILLNSGLFE